MAYNEAYPFSDKNMTWDNTSQMYLLTETGYTNATGLIASLKEPALSGLFRRQSRQINNFILEHTSSKGSKQWKRLFIAKYDNFREPLYYALVAQMEYYFASAGSLLALQSGVNIEKGKVIDDKVLRGVRRIAREAELELEAVGLLYTGQTQPFPDDLEIKYIEDLS